MSVPVAESGGVSSPRAAQEAAWRGFIARCAERDQAGMSALYDESASLVYSLALRMVGNPADAEEVTMDVYQQVWRRAASYDGSRGTVASWLVTLARSRAIDRVRSQANRRQKEQPLPEILDLAAAGLSPERETAETQRKRRIAAALASLSPEQREALNLAFFSGLTHQEVAERLGQPLGTVKTRIRLGMMKLKEQLEPFA